MGNCLVTKLQGVVQNDSLMRMDEIKLNVISSSGTSTLLLFWRTGSTGDCSIKLKGTTFADGTTEKTFTAGTSVNVSINNATNAMVYVRNKYDLQELSFRFDSKLVIDTSDVKYLSSLINQDAWRVTGSLEDIIFLYKKFNKVEWLSVFYGYDFYGNVSDLLPYAASLKKLVLENTQIEGDILPVLINATNLTNNLVGINGSNNILLGDVSTIPHDKILCINGTQVATWKTTRSTTRKIISLYGLNLGADIDAMLINQADCQIGYTGLSDNRYKNIYVFGTRTSASDAAVETLKSKGYTITINDVVL